jgi:hypothetical protein
VIERALAAGLVGATVVWSMFWLEQSVLPEAIHLPLAIGRLLILGSALAAAWLPARRWPTFVAGITIGGAGLGWAFHEIHPLVLCQSDVLYRPCSSSEIGWMVLPAVLLITLGGVVAAVALRHSRAVVPA